MSLTNAIRYKGYFLDCEPAQQGEARFIAQVIISHETGQALAEYAFHDLRITEAAAEAVSFAKAWGRHWVDEHIQQADLSTGIGVHSN